VAGGDDPPVVDDEGVERTGARPPSRSVPVVWSSAPVRWMDIGTLNMSTIVVLQNMPSGLNVNSAQSCRTS
jgi:hypothetical protein